MIALFLSFSETRAIVMADKLIFMQEKDQRYTLLSVDQKPPVISLRDLMVREVATDAKALFLVNKEGPQMYEFLCSTSKEKKL